MTKLILFINLLLSLISNGQEKSLSPDKQLDPCKSQIDLYCQKESSSKELREIIKCLIKNDDKLSVECKQEIQRIAQASRQTSPPGGGPLGSIGGLTGQGSQAPSFIYDGRYVQNQNNKSQTPAITENNFNASLPIYKNENDTISTTLSGGNLHTGDAINLDSGVKLPTDLYRTELGLQFSRKLSGQRAFGAKASVGYTGDKLASNTEIYNLNANYSFPGENEGYWVVMVMISNNSPFGAYVPIPGFIYIYRTPTFTGLFGLPILSLQWTPVAPWSYSFSFFGPIIKTEISYGLIDKTQLFAGLSWKQQRYLLSDRTNVDERLTFEEKNLEAGFRRPLFDGAFADFQIGNSFDRSAYLGQKLFNKDGGKADLDSNLYLKGSLKFVF